MDVSYKNIDLFFNEILRDLKYQEDTKAYIISIYTKYKSSEFDFSKDSITLMYARAYYEQNFLIFQNIGDWIFFINTITPQFSFASQDYYNTIARLSYYSCYKLINRQWRLYEQLADEFIEITDDVRYVLTNNLK